MNLNDLNERFSYFVSAINVAQKNGGLTLDDAVVCKESIDKILKGESLKESFAKLIAMCEKAQKNGAFTIADAHVVYLISAGINELIDNYANGSSTEAKEEEKKEEKPESTGDQSNVDFEVHDTLPEPEDEKPAKTKTSKKKTK